MVIVELGKKEGRKGGRRRVQGRVARKENALCSLPYSHANCVPYGFRLK